MVLFCKDRKGVERKFKIFYEEGDSDLSDDRNPEIPFMPYWDNSKTNEQNWVPSNSKRNTGKTDVDEEDEDSNDMDYYDQYVLFILIDQFYINFLFYYLFLGKLLYFDD